MIQSRRTAEKKEERYDLFSSLLEAHGDVDDGGEVKLSTPELIGKNDHTIRRGPSTSILTYLHSQATCSCFFWQATRWLYFSLS